MDSICKHLKVTVNDLDLAQFHAGFDIELDYCLWKEDIAKVKKEVGKKKKKPPKRPESLNKLRESDDSSLNTTNRTNFN